MRKKKAQKLNLGENEENKEVVDEEEESSKAEF